MMSSLLGFADCDFPTPRMCASEASVSTKLDLIRRLGTDINKGLTENEAEKRRRVYGLNEFVIKADDPLWKKYLNQVELGVRKLKPMCFN